MQGAADAAAVGGGAWMARGMNLMVLDNKGMADLLSVMISVHAVRQTAEAMVPIAQAALDAAIAASLASFGVCAPCDFLVEQLGRELAFWISFQVTMIEPD